MLARLGVGALLAGGAAYFWLMGRWRLVVAGLIATVVVVGGLLAMRNEPVPVVEVSAPRATGGVTFVPVGQLTTGPRTAGGLDASLADRTGLPASSSSVGQGAVAPFVAPIAAPTDRASLVRALQSGLKRADCYDGPINGFWTTRSRDAMARFLAQINAKLPVLTPDPVLLAALDTNQNKVCGSGDGAVAADGATRPRPDGLATSSLAAAAPAAIAAAGALNSGSARRERSALADNDDDDDVEPAPKNRNVRTSPAGASKPQTSYRKSRRKRQPTAFDGVSKAMGSNFKSLQRSLKSLFN